VVTAQNGNTTKTYSITVIRQGNALLRSLTFSPQLATATVAGPNYKNYTATVNSTITTVQITPVAEDPTSTIKVNDITVASGATSDPISLNIGANTINTVVTAADGTTIKTYSLVITRTYSTLLTSLKVNPFTPVTTVPGPDYKDYTASVKNTVSTISVTAVTQDPTSTIKVNGVTVASGTASTAIPLNVGNNTVTTVVTAADGMTSRTYSIVITRGVNALLASLTFSPRITTTTVAGPDFKDYTATVANTTSSVKVTPVTQDATSTVTVNNLTVASGTATSIPLNVGDNTIATIVTAQDGTTTNTYNTVITRLAPPGSASLYDEKLVAVAPVKNTDIVVHQNVSPNGDGNSDVLLIDGITTYPDNTLQIMSRNGQLVYEAKGYDNVTKVFDGHAGNGKLQQAGTYFYSLEYKVGTETKHKTGYLVLRY
jgi:gliding motility-associated-like protein